MALAGWLVGWLAALAKVPGKRKEDGWAGAVARELARACPAAVSAARPHASPAVPPTRGGRSPLSSGARTTTTTTTTPPVGSRVRSGALPAADHAALVPTEPALVVKPPALLRVGRGPRGKAPGQS
jgi:hypothetical protein